jgi:hypothetical protein
MVFKKGERTIVDLTRLDEKFEGEKGYKVDFIVEENPKDKIPEVIAEIEYDIDK